MKRLMCGLVPLLAATAMAGAANAQSATGERTNPYWLAPPEGDLASELFPEFAGFIGESGWARIRCHVEKDGHPYLCEVEDEAPHGLGFGSAARVIIASAQVGAARVNGVPVPATVTTTVHFQAPDFDAPWGGWTGPAPSAGRLALAGQLVDTADAGVPPTMLDRMVDGLDYDRRVVVAGWVEELMPADPAREREVRALQLARLFTDDQLRRLIAGEEVEPPTTEEFDAACPDPTPEELTAMRELRRRYCDRYGCGTEMPAFFTSET